MANFTITYRLWNSTSDQSMTFPGTSDQAARFAYNAIRSGGWTTAAISDGAAQKKLAELMERTHKKTHINVAPALLSLSAMTKELHKAAMQRELTQQEVAALAGTISQVMRELPGYPQAEKPVATKEPEPIVLAKPAPPVPTFDALPPKGETKKEEPKKGIFTR